MSLKEYSPNCRWCLSYGKFCDSGIIHEPAHTLWNYFLRFLRLVYTVLCIIGLLIFFGMVLSGCLETMHYAFGGN